MNVATKHALNVSNMYNHVLLLGVTPIKAYAMQIERIGEYKRNNNLLKKGENFRYNTYVHHVCCYIY